MSAVGASPGTGIPRVDGDERAAVPCDLAGEPAHEPAPIHVADGRGQAGMLDHRLHAQALYAHRLVLTDDARREPVQEVAATVRDAVMDAGHRAARLVALARAELRLGQAAL